MDPESISKRVKQLEHQIQAQRESESKSRAIGRAAGNERMWKQNQSREAVLAVLARQLTVVQQDEEGLHREQWLEFYTQAIASLTNGEFTTAEIIFFIVNEWVTSEPFMPQAIELLQAVTGDNEPLDKYLEKEIK